MKRSSTITSCNVYKFILSSPVGDIEIASCSKGLHSVYFTNEEDITFSPDEKQPVILKPSQSHIITECDPAQECYQWLKNFFAFNIKASTDIPPLCTAAFRSDTFSSKALQILPTVAPFGTTITYKKLAAACGNAKACRAVGHAMSSNPYVLVIPCHRVVCSSGEIGNYAKGKKNKVKQWLLNFEKSSTNIVI
ncbi:hypothetical protein Btru_036035 [Bulinus truncatus]|nr:hypothetical protein Btru_036035 [Bulinus truncatus]